MNASAEKPFKPDQPEIEVLTASDWDDYELVDSGDGLKLERYGNYTFVRPEPQAMWPPALGESVWRQAHARFRPTGEESGGHWERYKPIEEAWLMIYKGLKFYARLTAGRHLGVFPEQSPHWDWARARIQEARRPIQALNLFGYTGIASLAAAQAGANVTHVDASRKSVTWARENQAASGLNERPIRWIIDDAVKFIRREQRRQKRYEAILLDPPKFGRGPRGEVWEFFELFPQLLEACVNVLSEQPLFIVVTAYAIRVSALSLSYTLQALTEKLGGRVSAGELSLRESSAGRQISLAIYARWEAGN